MDRLSLPLNGGRRHSRTDGSSDLRLHYRDNDLLIVEKPAGLATVPVRGGISSIAERLAERHPELRALPDLGACHRLDNQTSGLLLFARNQKGYEKMRAAFSQDRVGREYLARIEGRLSGPLKISWPIGPDPKSSKKVKVYKNRPEARRHRALAALTMVRPVGSSIGSIDSGDSGDSGGSGGSTTVVAITIRGGRRHQIRVHLKAAGHPVIHLHASRLTFVHPVSGMRVDVRSEPPPEIGGASPQENRASSRRS